MAVSFHKTFATTEKTNKNNHLNQKILLKNFHSFNKYFF